MDLQTAKLLNGKSWNRTKFIAFALFAIAGALLIASLGGNWRSTAKAAENSQNSPIALSSTLLC